ncbi:MAG TPA: hypothetical protein PLC82_12265 [Smithellaceae bacterium]|nr:hypothetical protein [Smithellaceae bacterium]
MNDLANDYVTPFPGEKSKAHGLARSEKVQKFTHPIPLTGGESRVAGFPVFGLPCSGGLVGGRVRVRRWIVRQRRRAVVVVTVVGGVVGFVSFRLPISGDGVIGPQKIK